MPSGERAQKLFSPHTRPLRESRRTCRASFDIGKLPRRGLCLEAIGRPTNQYQGISMATKRNVIAIVDDDAGMRTALQNLLFGFGYRTEGYTSAEEFVRAV